MERPLSSLRSLPLCRLALSGTAALVACVSTAVQCSPAYPHALGQLLFALVANGPGCRPAASALDVDGLHAGRAIANVTDPWTAMSTRQCLPAGPVAARNRILAAFSSLTCELSQRCFAARAMGNDIRRTRTVAGFGILGVTFLAAPVDCTVECSIANVLAVKRASPALRHNLAILSRVADATWLLLRSLCTKYLFLHLSTIATSRYTHLTSST